MADSLGRAVARWLFGEDGSVAMDVELHLVMIATSTAVAGIFVVSPIVSELAGPFGVSEAQIGQLITVFTAPSILLVPVMGVLADRIGRKRVLVAGLLLFGAAGTAIGLTPSFRVALGLRVVQGIGYAAVMPITVAILGDLYEGGREATAQGLRVASIQGMSLVSPPIAGVIVLASWRYPFLLYLLAIVVAVWVWVTLPEIVPGDVIEIRSYIRDLFSSLQRPVMVLVMLSFTVRFLLTFVFFAFVSVLLARVFGASSVTSGLVVSAFGLVSMVSSTQAGRLTASWNPHLVMAGSFAVTGIGLALLGAGSTYPLLVVGVTLFGLGSGVTAPVQKSLVTQLVSASHRAGAVSSAVIFQSIGQTAGPLLMGLFLQRSSVIDAFVVFGVGGGAVGVLLMGLAYIVAGRSGGFSATADG